MDKFYPEYLDKLKEYIILEKRMRTSCRCDVEYLRVGLKGKYPSKSWWIEKEKVKEQFPHISID